MEGVHRKADPGSQIMTIHKKKKNLKVIILKSEVRSALATMKWNQTGLNKIEIEMLKAINYY